MCGGGYAQHHDCVLPSRGITRLVGERLKSSPQSTRPGPPPQHHPPPVPEPQPRPLSPFLILPPPSQLRAFALAVPSARHFPSTPTPLLLAPPKPFRLSINTFLPGGHCGSAFPLGSQRTSDTSSSAPSTPVTHDPSGNSFIGILLQVCKLPEGRSKPILFTDVTRCMAPWLVQSRHSSYLLCECMSCRMALGKLLCFSGP